MLACKALSFFTVFSHTYVVTAGSYPLPPSHLPLPSWFPLSPTMAFLPALYYPDTPWFIFSLSFRLHIWEKICSTVCFSEFRFFSYHDFQKALTLQRIIKFSFATVEHMLVAWPQTSMCSCGLEKWAGLAQVDSLSQDFTLRVLSLTAAYLSTLWCKHITALSRST